MSRFPRCRLLPALLLPLLAACVAHADRCWVCEREVHDEVRATLVLANGRKVPACCPRCALHYRHERGEALRDIEVTDHGGGGRLPLGAAFLVEGSDLTPCLEHHPVVDERRVPMQVCYDRCMPSLIAFAAGTQARAFIEEHGGALHAPGSAPDLSPPPAPR
ncbi:MAG: hypothetical protein ACRD6R_12825 [Candidatus Polarisedimenticolia bacterium]